MANGKSTPPPLMAPAAGVLVGVLVFWGLNFWFQTPIIPTLDDVIDNDPMADVVRPTATTAAADQAGPMTPYQRVCQACHQADGKGMPGAFPPLAGSDWMTADPETPIRIVLLGLTGPIEVNGQKFNATMPPPPAMTDAEIAEAITFARSNFGNQASEVTAEMVAQVRESLGGRTKQWTAEELIAIRPAPGEEAAVVDGGVAADGSIPPAEGAEAEPADAPPEAEGEAPAAPAAPVPAAPAPAAPPPAAPAAPAPKAPAAAPAAQPETPEGAE